MSKTARFQTAVPRARPADSRVIAAYSLSSSRGYDGAILRISDRIEMTLTMRIDVDFRRQRSDTFPFLESKLTQLLSEFGKSLKTLKNFNFPDSEKMD